MVAQEAHQIRPLAFDNSLGRKLGEFCAVLLSEVGLLRNAVNVEPQRETSLKQLVHLGLEVDVVSALLQHRVRELEEWLRGQPKIGLGIRHHDLRRTLRAEMLEYSQSLIVGLSSAYTLQVQKDQIVASVLQIREIHNVILFVDVVAISLEELLVRKLLIVNHQYSRTAPDLFKWRFRPRPPAAESHC